MKRSGHVAMSTLLSDDFAMSRALFELRLALCAHYVRVPLAAHLAGRACRQIQDSLLIASSALQQSGSPRLA